ncbi:hypothetical protein [Defluviitalea phaphyphila]|uniref:hypothetical protein n=1 Tax=Defluviitalea phaphyphila TaxID=1473580 RepID=UPI00072FDD64|nr:hypothetical protein [Defluviitalea phaphyphila]
MRKYLYIAIFMILLLPTTKVMAGKTDTNTKSDVEINTNVDINSDADNINSDIDINMDQSNDNFKESTDEIDKDLELNIDEDDINEDIDIDEARDNSNENIDEIDDEDDDEKEGLLDLGLIKITAGLTKEKEVTFDKFRNISGEAKEGTKITFNVYQDKENKECIQSYSQKVGPSGLFSQLIDLKEGENYIEIIVELKDENEIFIFQINRKKEEIKKEIEEVKISNIFSIEEDKSDQESKILKSLLD